MSIIMRGCYFFVGPNNRRFQVSSNFTNYLELGINGITKYYLEAKIVNEEFLVVGTLLDKEGNTLCIMEDSFIKSSEKFIKEMTAHGYRILDENHNVIFEIQAMADLICHLKGTIYGDHGEIIAKDMGEDFIILKGPAILGKSGNSIGMKID